MPDPFPFNSISPRFGLPLLFAGQAQKEAFVNEAHALADALMHCAIEGTLSSPPATPANGEAWLVGPAPTAEWADNEGDLACHQGGNWLFVTPRDGLTVLDRSTGQTLLFSGDWKIPAVPLEPTGGTTVDVEARDALASLVAALRVAGVFPTS